MATMETFEKATTQLSAYALARGGKPVGRIVIRYPRDGASRLAAFVQVWGADMVAGYAGGYGYDKTSAALEKAAAKLADMTRNSAEFRSFDAAADAQDIAAALADVEQRSWSQSLEDFGFSVLRVI